jgi:hypothetical protein
LVSSSSSSNGRPASCQFGITGFADAQTKTRTGVEGLQIHHQPTTRGRHHRIRCTCLGSFDGLGGWLRQWLSRTPCFRCTSYTTAIWPCSRTPRTDGIKVEQRSVSISLRTSTLLFAASVRQSLVPAILRTTSVMVVSSTSTPSQIWFWRGDGREHHIQNHRSRIVFFFWSNGAYLNELLDFLSRNQGRQQAPQVPWPKMRPPHRNVKLGKLVGKVTLGIQHRPRSRPWTSSPIL